MLPLRSAIRIGAWLVLAVLGEDNERTVCALHETETQADFLGSARLQRRELVGRCPFPTAAADAVANRIANILLITAATDVVIKRIGRWLVAFRIRLLG